jgi:hypothetical protein
MCFNGIDNDRTSYSYNDDFWGIPYGVQVGLIDLIRHRIISSNYIHNSVLSNILLSFLNLYCLFVCLMVFNATLNNISVIWWQSVLLMEETGGLIENSTRNKVIKNQE